VAVLHAWVGVDNPDGPFAAENWTLPWLRAGLVPPAGAPRDAARAVALAAGGDAFYAAQLRVAAGLDGADADAAARVTADHGRRVVEWAGQRQGRPPGAADIEWLEVT
jgi:hypothetical protein